MPYDVKQTVLVDGPRHAVVHFIITSDGTSGEMTNYQILDTKNDIYPIGQATQTTIEQIWWGQSYFDSVLYRQDTVPVPIWVMPVGSDSHVDFRSFGGIKVPIDLDGNGNLLLSTFGFAGVGSIGSYTIALRKD